MQALHTEVGIAYFSAKLRADKIRGGHHPAGLKLIFQAGNEKESPSACTLLAKAHRNILHIGQAVFALKGNRRIFRGHGVQLSDTCGSAIKRAAFNGLNRIAFEDVRTGGQLWAGMARSTGRRATRRRPWWREQPDRRPSGVRVVSGRSR